MANAEVAKITQHVLIGKADAIMVPKLVMYVLLEPGTGDDGTNRQGHVYSQIIRRS